MTVNYALGKIYTLSNNVDKTVYVGSSAQLYLSTRMGTHRRDAKNLTITSPLYTAMRLHGQNAFKMLLHHVYPCSSKAELEAEEFRILDQFIAEERQVYNQIIGNKHSTESKEKMSNAKKGVNSGSKHYSFNYGCVRLNARNECLSWTFWYVPQSHPGSRKCHSFSVGKYGFWKAKALCEEIRKNIYPEYKNDEELCIEAFGNIDL